MNKLILHFLFWMAVSGHENINFTFFLFWMTVPGREHINFTSAFISLLFLFSFHNKNVLFWVENKKKIIYFQLNEKENHFAPLLSLYFQFKIIKVQSKINKFMSFWGMAVVGHHRSVAWNNTSTFDVKISAFFRSQSLAFWVFSVFKTATWKAVKVPQESHLRSQLKKD